MSQFTTLAVFTIVRYAVFPRGLPIFHWKASPLSETIGDPIDVSLLVERHPTKLIARITPLVENYSIVSAIGISPDPHGYLLAAPAMAGTLLIVASEPSHDMRVLLVVPVIVFIVSVEPNRGYPVRDCEADIFVESGKHEERPRSFTDGEDSDEILAHYFRRCADGFVGPFTLTPLCRRPPRRVAHGRGLARR